MAAWPWLRLKMRACVRGRDGCELGGAKDDLERSGFDEARVWLGLVGIGAVVS